LSLDEREVVPHRESMVATTYAPPALKGLVKTAPTKCITCLRPTLAEELIRHGGECFGCEGDREMRTNLLDTND
jgi:hypothetical protein